jgi:hypothetical protein
MKKLILPLLMLPALSYSASEIPDTSIRHSQASIATESSSCITEDPVLRSIHIHDKDAAKAFISEYALFKQNPGKYSAVAELDKELSTLYEFYALKTMGKEMAKRHFCFRPSMNFKDSLAMLPKLLISRSVDDMYSDIGGIEGRIKVLQRKLRVLKE